MVSLFVSQENIAKENGSAAGNLAGGE